MAVPSMASWSTTAATNATADPNVNWAEGQSPSSVNDSARAMMASVAKWRIDNAGALLTGGTSTAYTLTTNQVFDSLANMSGHSLRVRFHTANGGSPVTLNVDGLGAKNIVLVNGGSSITTGTLQTNGAYDLVYDNSNSNWIMVGGQPGEFPSGTIMLFRQTAAPTGWTKDTSNYNNHAIRVVTGTPSSGGTTGFTSVFAGRTITQGHLPSVNLTGTPNTASQAVSYTVGGGGTALALNSGAAVTGAAQGGGGSSSFYTTGGHWTTFDGTTITFPSYTVPLGGSGTAFDMAVQYVDCIFATKA